VTLLSDRECLINHEKGMCRLNGFDMGEWVMRQRLQGIMPAVNAVLHQDTASHVTPSFDFGETALEKLQDPVIF
jgi:hypothetical protein